MRVFVTGATGFVGSGVVRELTDAGHQVLGLARSQQAAASLQAAGAAVHRGTLDDLAGLRTAAAASDGVIHTAYTVDFSNFAATAHMDRRAIETLGEALVGSDRPFVVTSVTVALPQGRLATEEDTTPDPESFALPRFASENAALSFAARGVRVSLVRLPPSVHGQGDHGFIPRLIDIARTKGIAAYPGDGSNRWPAVHRLDAAHLYRLALEQAPPGTRLHAVRDEGVPVRGIAEVIGRHLQLPVTAVLPQQAFDHFGFLGPIFSLDVPASSTMTQKQLDWRPSEPGLIEDIDKGHYFSD